VTNATTYKPIAATYEGEALAVTFKLTAENGLATPATTTNYKTVGGVANLDGTAIANFGFGAVDQADATPPTGATALTSRLVPGTSSGTWIDGVGTFTANLRLSRPASPDGPYESFNLGIAPTDADGVTLNSYDMASVPASAVDRKLVGTTKIRYGRLKINNTHGSELLNLPVSVAAQYWNGSSYVTNIDDSCTSIAAADFASPLTYVPLLKFTTTLLGGGKLSSGTGQITLTKPTGFAGKGSVDVSSGLTISPFLPGTGRQTFGIYKGGPIIYMREMY
jgi:MSHA biogenesis protein MshQ